MTEAQKKKHFWLVAAEVIHHPVGDKTTVAANNFNTVLTTDGPTVDAKALGRAQVGIQQQLHMATQGREIQVVDVIIIALSPLGEQTDKDFFGEDPAVPETPPVQ